MAIWDPKNECLPRREVEALQDERLRALVRRAYDHLPYYRAKMDAIGLKPEDIRGRADLAKLPFTTKADMRENYPYGLLAVPMREVVRIHASSGTTGRPTVVGYTRSDLTLWSEVCARFIAAAGVSDEDIAQIAFGYGLFTGGFGLHYGLERVGAAVIPVSAGNTERQLLLLREFGSTTLICTPSYAVVLGEAVEKLGIREELRLRWGLFGGEPWTRAMGDQIERLLGLQATDNYGLSEIIGPGVAGECVEYRDGMHISEDHFLCEVVDPETLEPLGWGERGELVVTALTKEAVPVLRYRTRDITRLTPEPCPCGRTTARMEKVVGRTDDMLIVRGVNVYPSQIESVLLEFEHAEPHYQLVLRREGARDTLEAQVEVSEELFSDRMRDLRELEARIAGRLKSVLGISVRLRLVEPKTLARSEGKAKRVLDLRGGSDT